MTAVHTEDIDYPQFLDDADAIAAHIASLASDYVDENCIAEYFHGCGAMLRQVAIDDLQEGDSDTNARSRRKEQRYAKLDPSTIPPLVVDEIEGRLVIKDGNHRYRVARQLGLTHVPCYVVAERHLIDAMKMEGTPQP